MKKYPLQTERIKEHTVRYTLKLEGDPIPNKNMALNQLLRDIIDTPMLLKCGPSFPDKIGLTYDGDVWLLTGVVEQQIDMTSISFEQSEDGKSAKSINPFEGRY